MKYLNIIMLIILAASGIVAYGLLQEKRPSPQDIALTINGHNINKQTISAEKNRTGYHIGSQELYGAIITKELLIQEAKRLNLDKEESFRQALQNYYENSLINTLLDHKNQELEVVVTEEEIDRYLQFLGSTVTFTRLDTLPASAGATISTAGQSTTALFDDLAEPIKLLLTTLTPGQVANRFDTGSERYALRLDKIKRAETTVDTHPDRERIKQKLVDFHREQKLNQWLLQLNEAASITIHHQKPAP